MFHIEQEFWVTCFDCDFFDVADSAGEAEEKAKRHLAEGGLDHTEAEQPFISHVVHIETKTVVRACCDNCGGQIEAEQPTVAPKIVLPN